MRYLALAFALAACAADPTVAPRDCTPGQTAACVCPGAAGVQTCGADGRLGACVCPGDAGGVDAGRSDSGAGADVVDAARDAGLRPADPRCADRLTARDWCGPDDGGACVDLMNDPLNCGTCRSACAPPRSECFGGICFVPTDAGTADASR